MKVARTVRGGLSGAKDLSMHWLVTSLLSIGAAFGIFAGFYYWIEKITGRPYNEVYGQIHFWLIFIGVNLTFFPIHFLGLAGIPRRIPDYPDAYAGWNALASYGSIVSAVASLFFFYVIYDCLTSASNPSNETFKHN